MPVNNLPPQNIEAEESILGGILLDPEAIAVVSAILPPEAIYIPAHRDIYKAALALHEKGKPTDLMSVTSYLYDHELLDRIGGQGKLSQLVDRTVSAINCDRYAQLVMEKYHRRQLIKAGHDIVQTGYDNTLEVEVAHDKALGLIDSVAPDSGVAKCYATVREILDIPGILEPSPGIPTGFPEMDEIGGGIKKQDLTLLAGRPSMGKSSMALQIARNVSEITPVVFFSLEMSKEQLAVRLLCLEAGVDSEKIDKETLSPAEKDRLIHARKVIEELPLVIYDNPERKPTPSQMGTFLKKTAKTHGEIGLFLVDHLHEMHGAGTEKNANADLGRIMGDIRSVSRYHGIPPIVLSQLSRACESRQNKRPMLSDLRESGAIEQIADKVWMLYRDEYYNPGSEFAGLAEAICTKYRNGRTGTATLEFSQATFRTRKKGGW